MEHQSFRSAHAQHMHRFAETMNTVQKPPTIAGEASGSQAGDALKEHDYIGLSDHQQQHTQSQNVGKELNMRRTQLQLGLPGSPENDPKDAACSKPQMGTFEHDKNESQQQQGVHKGIVKDKEVRAKQRVDLKQPQHCVEEHIVGGAAEDSAAHQPRAPVGWPPVQSFRKNSLPTPQTKPGDNASSTAPSAAAAAPQQEAPVQPGSSLFIKVYMDGVSIGRKVNLRTHSSYEKLSAALEEMFRRFIKGQAENGNSKSMGKKLNFIYGSDYVLTYEDKDGDLMLVGDVPWGMFVGNVKRLRIMKGSEAIGLGE